MQTGYWRRANHVIRRGVNMDLAMSRRQFPMLCWLLLLHLQPTVVKAYLARWLPMPTAGTRCTYASTRSNHLPVADFALGSSTDRVYGLDPEAVLRCSLRPPLSGHLPGADFTQGGAVKHRHCQEHTAELRDVHSSAIGLSRTLCLCLVANCFYSSYILFTWQVTCYCALNPTTPLHGNRVTICY